MDIVTLAILAFIAVVGIAMLGKLLGHLIGAAAIIAAIINDLVDIGIIAIIPELGWLADLAIFLLILLAYRNAGALISLLDLIPNFGFLPFHALSLLVSWKIRQKSGKAYVVRR